ncbi:MAG: hypothetical protein LBI82_07565 [Dysgonamonadaceae bacterium]|nr:hypothetical protein [Dysgonamonadaceae bacterium]
MRTYFLLIFAIVMFLGVTNTRAQGGYIIKVEGNKIYLNMPNAKVSDIVSVLNNGGSMIDPRTGQTIYTEPEVVGQLKIIAVQGAYSVGMVYGNTVIYPQEGMTVRKGTVMQRNNYGEATVMIAPAELNFPQGFNTMVGDGYIGDYVSAALMEHLLKSDKIQVIDRSMLSMQQGEISLGQSGMIDYNTAIEYGKISGVRYAVKIILQKPDVVTIGNNVPIKALAGMVSEATNSNNSSRGRTNQVQNLLPENMSTSNIKVAVNIVTQIVDLQTGRLLYQAKATGKASGAPSIGLELGNYGNNGYDTGYYDNNYNNNYNTGSGNTININQKNGSDFMQTVTGKAIDDAFKKIGKDLNKYFKENL